MSDFELKSNFVRCFCFSTCTMKVLQNETRTGFICLNSMTDLLALVSTDSNSPKPHGSLMMMLVYSDLTQPAHKRRNKYFRWRRSAAINKINTCRTHFLCALCEAYVSEHCLFDCMASLCCWCMNISVPQMSEGYVCFTDARFGV